MRFFTSKALNKKYSTVSHDAVFKTPVQPEPFKMCEADFPCLKRRLPAKVASKAKDTPMRDVVKRLTFSDIVKSVSDTKCDDVIKGLSKSGVICVAAVEETVPETTHEDVTKTVPSYHNAVTSKVVGSVEEELFKAKREMFIMKSELSKMKEKMDGLKLLLALKAAFVEEAKKHAISKMKISTTTISDIRDVVTDYEYDDEGDWGDIVIAETGL